MEKDSGREAARRTYEAPAITRVHVDPVNELLMLTAVCFQEGNPGCTNTSC